MAESIADKLQTTLNSKSAIKTALVNKDANPTDDLSTYAGLIDDLTVSGIVIPSIVSPADGATDVETLVTLKSSPFTGFIDERTSDVHVASTWNFYSDASGSTLIHTSGRDTENLTSYNPSDNGYDFGAGETIYAEVEYEGQQLGKAKSDLSEFSTATVMAGPGPQQMTDYDESTDTGYYGVVDASTLFTGNALASTIGLSAGSSQHSNAGYFKFYVGPNATCWRSEDAPGPGKPYVIFIAEKPFRNDLSWEDIYQAGAVYGVDGNGPDPSGGNTNQMTTVNKSGSTMKVQLCTGADANPYTNQDGVGSYWNELMYRIHSDTPSEQNGGNWANFSDSYIVVGSGNGRRSWCQESGGSGSLRVYRGSASLAGFGINSPTPSNSTRGWRPALVVIGA